MRNLQPLSENFTPNPPHQLEGEYCTHFCRHLGQEALLEKYYVTVSISHFAREYRIFKLVDDSYSHHVLFDVSSPLTFFMTTNLLYNPNLRETTSWKLWLFPPLDRFDHSVDLTFSP